MLPLYKDVQNHIPQKFDPKSNAGLWYDKFCNQWKDNFKSLKENGKLDWINEVSNPQSANLDDYRARLYRLIKQQSGTPIFYKLASAFVTGLGREHPVENGFAWHHTLGVPYLPATSIKGMVRAWAGQWCKASDQDVNRIIGNQKNVGSVIFLDAIPIEPVQLKADIMTPHYAPYYSGDPVKNPPADWYSPVPIPFLVVAPGCTFQFGILPKHGENDQDKKDCEQAAVWLRDSLEWIGAGAKTSVGFGRFSQNKETSENADKDFQKAIEQEQKERRLQDQLKGKSALAIEIIKLSLKENWEINKNVFTRDGVIEAWLDRLENDPQRDAIDYLSKLVKKHFPGLLENPDATKGKNKNKSIFKDRQKKIAKRLLDLPSK